MLSRFFNQLLAEDDEGDVSIDTHKKSERQKIDLSIAITWLIIIAIALATRLFFLFIIDTPEDAHPGWYEDVYHHWQIAYLSYSVGFKEGFLRLWDLKGVEYFWGLMHPLILGGLMKILGSTSIVIARVLSLVAGSLSLGFVYLLTRRYFNQQIALAAALMAALHPVAIFSDASGMQEPLGIFLLLFGLWSWPKLPIATGILLMFSGMVRAEYWLLGATVVVFMTFGKEKLDHKVMLVISYIITMSIYMKYLVDHTGNAIYPVWWNFLGNAVGKWQADIAPTPEMIIIKYVYIGIIVAAFLGLLFLLKKRLSYAPFFAIGLGNWLLLGVTVGLSKYLLSYLPRFWVDRIMLLPYMFLAIWIALIIFTLLKHKWLQPVGWIIVIGIIGASQLLWKPIYYWLGFTKTSFEDTRKMSNEIMSHYTEGALLIFEDRPTLTYHLVTTHGVKGENIVGQMFDPFYYMQGDPYLNWGENRIKIVNWLQQENIKLLVFPKTRERYMEIVKREPDIFTDGTLLPQWGLWVYQVAKIEDKQIEKL